ncbi:MAG: response regulator [Candidatus Acidiferrales bacterium]
MSQSTKDFRVLVVDDNPLVREMMRRSMSAHYDVIAAADGADALLMAVDRPPDLIVCDYKMAGLDGRQLYEKLRGREATRNVPFIFVASRGDIEEKLRPVVASGEDFVTKPFFMAELERAAKRFVDRLHLERLQKSAARPGVIQGRLEEMGVTELMQSLEMGQKSCRLTLRRGAEVAELYFDAGQCKHAKLGATEGDEVANQVVHWADGEFEIDFNATTDRVTTTRSTTGLLMEAMRLMDEASTVAGGSGDPSSNGGG